MTVALPQTMPVRGPWRSSARMAREVVLNVAAAGGALCILLTIAAMAFGISLIMFKTGSMTPTIPAGSVALVREIPARDIKVGDVITVDRDGALPITHRVVELTTIDREHALVTLRGDANPVNDPAPYTVSTVRIVLGSLPGLAPVLVSAANPVVMGAITIVVAGVVTWAFWPRAASAGPLRHRPKRERGRHAGAPGRLGEASWPPRAR